MNELNKKMRKLLNTEYSYL